jgi:hypothetical protein
LATFFNAASFQAGRALRTSRGGTVQDRGEADGDGGAEAAVHFDEDVEVGTDGIADGFDEGDGTEAFFAVEFVEAGAEGVELGGFVATGDDGFGGFREFFGRAFDGVPAVGVGLDFLAHGAAHEAIDGLVEGFADDVPAGHFDERDAGHGDFAGAAVVVAAHGVDDEFAIEGVLADDVTRGGFGEVAEQGVRVVDHADFADAGEAFVGFEDEEGEVAPGRAHDEGADFGDFHV